MKIKIISVLLTIAIFQPIAIWAADRKPVKAAGLSLDIKGVDVDIPGTVKEIWKIILDVVSGIKKYPKEQQIVKLKKVSHLLASLAGEESLMASQLAQNIIISGAPEINENIQRLNQLRNQSTRTFNALRSEILEFSQMDGIDKNLVAGLRCFASDSIIYGYSVDACNVGQGTGQIFAAGRAKSENNIAYAKVLEIQKESKFLLQLALALDEHIMTMD